MLALMLVKNKPDMADSIKRITAQIQAILDALASGEIDTEQTTQLLETIVAGDSKLKSAKLDESFSMFD